MEDYKSTLNLPATGFPMKANLANKEPLRQRKWQEERLYQEMEYFISLSVVYGLLGWCVYVGDKWFY